MEEARTTMTWPLSTQTVALGNASMHGVAMWNPEILVKQLTLGIRNYIDQVYGG